MNYAIGADLGGTNIKFVVISLEGEVLEYSRCQTEDEAGSWSQSIKDKIEEIQNRHGQSANHVGIAAPGLAASDGLSIAHMQGRLEGLQGLVWTNFLKVSRPVRVLNDAHAALLGELWKGAAAGYRNVVLLTLGTGVGGAVYTDGRLIKGHIGRAGHLGHISVNSDGEPDIVGTPGSLEEMIGNYNLAERSDGRFTSTRQLVDAYRSGDALATRIWLRSIHHLAAALTSIINAFDPEVVILGGGIARAGSALFDPLSALMDQLEWRPLGNRVPIVSAALGEQAGAIGAAYHSILDTENRN
ncbi:MAG TPA: ROK family protein [Pyrinomonadaceae bacterium]|nr:ROK family protein [Pyrinomonadaceae bacterium]